MVFPASIVASKLASHRHRQQPQSAVEVDWSHPLARGLVFLEIPNAQGARDLVGGARAAPLFNTKMGTGPSGRSIATAGTSSEGWIVPYDVARLRTITTEMTIATKVDISAVASNSKLVCAPLFSTGWSAPYQSFALFRNSTGSNAAFAMGTLDGSVSRSAYFGANTFVAGTTNSYVVTRSGLSAHLLHNKSYAAAVSTNANWDANPVRWETGTDIALMNRSQAGFGEGTQGNMYYAAIWNRALSEAEARSFQDDPYQILKPQVRQNVFAFTPDMIYYPATVASTLPKFGATAEATTIPSRLGASAATLPKFGSAAAAVRTIPNRTAASAATLPKFGALAAAVRTIPARTAESAATLPKFGSSAGANGFQPGFSGPAIAILPKFGASAEAARTIPARTASGVGVAPRFGALASAVIAIAPRTATSSATLPKFGASGVALRSTIDRTAASASALPALGSLAAATRLPPPATASSAAILPRFTSLATAGRDVIPAIGAAAATLLRLRSSADGVSVPPPGTVVPLTVNHRRAPAWRLVDAGTGQGTLRFAAALDPNSLTYFTIDWTQEINGSSDTIWLDKDAIGVMLAPSAVAAGLLVHAITFDSTSVTLWLRLAEDQQNAPHWSGEGEAYPINFTVKTMSGQIFNRNVSIGIKQL